MPQEYTGSQAQSDTGPFALVPVWLLRAGVSARAIHLYAVLAARADYDSGKTWPSRRTLAKEVGVSEKTIDRTLAELVEAQALEILPQFTPKGDRDVNLYRVLRVTPGGDTNVGTGPVVDVQAESETQAEREEETSSEVSSLRPPKLRKVDGRDIAFDALARVCSIGKRSPRAKEVAVALAGTRTTPGIREQAWHELDSIEFPFDFEGFLVGAIGLRADLYRRKMPGAALTPTALAKWWTDLPNLPEARDGRSGSGADAVAIAEETLRRIKGAPR